MKITFLGHSAVLIENKGFKGLIDPFLKNNPSYKSNTTDIIDITHIFVTHGHGDHVGDTLEIAKNNNSIIIANEELSRIFRNIDATLNVHSVKIGIPEQFNFGSVEMTNAVHPGGFHDGEKRIDCGAPGGFIITIDQQSIFHSGDTSFSTELFSKLTKDFDIAFLPIGGHYTMNIDEAIQAVKMIHPKIVVPMHYNTFDLIKANPNEFKKKLEDSNVVILNSGESIKI